MRRVAAVTDDCVRARKETIRMLNAARGITMALRYPRAEAAAA